MMKINLEEYGVSCDTGDDDIPWRVLLALMLHVRNFLAADWLRGLVEACRDVE